MTVASVKKVPLDRTLPVVGTLFPKDEATISAEVEGKVEKTMAEFGDRVREGQEIAQIDTTAYEALARLAAANVAKAKANATNTEQILHRARELDKAGVAPASDLDKNLAEAEQARADVAAAEAAKAIADLNLARSHVRAPFEAAVADRIASAGDFMKVGTPLFRVVNDAVLKYIVAAPEKYVGQVQKEQSVIFTVDAYPGETFEGKVYLISPSVNTLNRSYAFGALVPNGSRKLKASSFARGELILERAVPTLTVPLEAVIQFAGVTRVFIVENGIAHSREVRAGRIHEGEQEILSGLKEGEKVVITGQSKLREGARVRIKEHPEGKAVSLIGPSPAGLPGSRRHAAHRRVSSAGFLTCRIADFPVGWASEPKRPPELSPRPAGWKTRETADWKVCATMGLACTPTKCT